MKMAYFMMGTTAQGKTLKKSTAQVPQMKEIWSVATPKGGGKGRGSQTPGTEHNAVRENGKKKKKKKSFVFQKATFSPQVLPSIPSTILGFCIILPAGVLRCSL